MAQIPIVIGAAVGSGAVLDIAERKRIQNEIADIEQTFVGTPANPSTKAAAVVFRGQFYRGLVRNRVVRYGPNAGTEKPHRGVDITANIGTPIYALAPGTVLAVGNVDGYGLAVQYRLDTPIGRVRSILYGHMDKAAVQPGLHLMGGQLIGYVGNSTAGPDGVIPPWALAIRGGMRPHLHMELHSTPSPTLQDSFEREDPVEWLRNQRIRYALV